MGWKKLDCPENDIICASLISLQVPLLLLIPHPLLIDLKFSAFQGGEVQENMVVFPIRGQVITIRHPYVLLCEYSRTIVKKKFGGFRRIKKLTF